MKYHSQELMKIMDNTAGIAAAKHVKGSFIAREFTNKKIFDMMSRLSQGHPNDRDFKEAERFIVRVLDSL